MPNPNKAKGDTWERDGRDHARANGFPGAERTRAGYARDHGDLHLAPGVIVQSKNCRTLRWAEWLEDLDEQIADAKADVGCLHVKRPGVGDPGRGLAVMTYDQWLLLARRAGYGTPIETEEVA